LLAIAYLRLAKHADNQNEKHRFIEDALTQASNSIALSVNNLEVRLAVQFTRELSKFDIGVARHLSSQIVSAVISSKNDHVAHHIYVLSETGHVVTDEEKIALANLSDDWLARLEEVATRYGGLHKLLAKIYSQVGRLAVPVDVNRGLHLFEIA